MLVNEKKAPPFTDPNLWTWLGPHLGSGPRVPKIEDTGDLELAPKGWAQKVKAVDPRATDVSLGMKTAGVFVGSQMAKPWEGLGVCWGCMLNLFGAGYGTELGRW